MDEQQQQTTGGGGGESNGQFRRKDFYPLAAVLATRLNLPLLLLQSDYAVTRCMQKSSSPVVEQSKESPYLALDALIRRSHEAGTAQPQHDHDGEEQASSQDPTGQP